MKKMVLMEERKNKMTKVRFIFQTKFAFYLSNSCLSDLIFFYRK